VVQKFGFLFLSLFCKRNNTLGKKIQSKNIDRRQWWIFSENSTKNRNAQENILSICRKNQTERNAIFCKIHNLSRLKNYFLTINNLKIDSYLLYKLKVRFHPDYIF
jgi:hypothetical protein